MTDSERQKIAVEMVKRKKYVVFSIASFRVAWNEQQKIIDKLRDEKEKIILAAEKVIHLDTCDQEGIQSGLPSTKEWESAIDSLYKSIQEKING